MAVQVVSQIRLKRPRKFHLCFTRCRNTLTQILDNQHITRNSSSLVFRSKRQPKGCLFSFYVQGVFLCRVPCTSDMPLTTLWERLGVQGMWVKITPCTTRSPRGNKNGLFCSRRDARARERERFHGFLFPAGDGDFSVSGRRGGNRPNRGGCRSRKP